MSKKINRGPDFIGIGVARAASTWIFRSLSEHPEICVSNKKEISFFNESYNYKKGLNYYCSFFNQCPESKITGEYTPAYIYHRETPYLIHKHYPNVKLIACLRNPVDRAYSHYQFDILKRGLLEIYKTFEEAVKKNRPLIARGFYYKQLKRYFSIFPRENILILFFEDIKKDPVSFMQKIYTFLNLKDVDFKPLKVNKDNKGTEVVFYKIPFINKIIYKYMALTGGESRRLQHKNYFERFLDYIKLKEYLAKFAHNNKRFIYMKYDNFISFPPMDKNIRDFLFKIYKKDITKLEDLLQMDLSFWK